MVAMISGGGIGRNGGITFKFTVESWFEGKVTEAEAHSRHGHKVTKVHFKHRFFVTLCHL